VAATGLEGGVVERLPTVTRTQLAWGAYALGALLLIVAVAVVIGFALAVLSLVQGAVVAFILVALLAALLLPEARTFWARLPR
jgi:uncharacterized membrane protein YkgB